VITPYWSDEVCTLLLGDALEVLRQMPDGSADCCVTSPPYYSLRDYGTEGQIGLEASPAEYVERLRGVFAEVRRVLADDGTLWLNIGDSYYSGKGSPTQPDSKNEGRRGWVRPLDRCGQDWAKPKDLLGLPWRLAFALQDDGWVLRNDIIWSKPNAMPESVTDRLSNRYEHVFLLARSRRYWFDLDAIREPLAHPEALDREIVFGGSNGGGGKVGASARRSGANRSVYGRAAGIPPGQVRPKNGGPGPHHDSAHGRGRNPGDVWTIATRPYPEAHFAVFPLEVPLRAIRAGCRPGGTVLDPFSGSGTTGEACRRLGRKYVGIDLNPAYHDLAVRRYAQGVMDFGEAS